MSRLLAALLAGLALLPPIVPSPATAGAPRRLEVTVTSRGAGDLLSVTARETFLRDLLAEVARRAGFQITEVVPLAEQSVTVEFASLPIERGLQQILAGQSFALVYRGPRGGPDRLSRLLVLGPDYRHSRVAPDSWPLTPDGPRPAEVDEPPRILPDDADAFDPDGPIEPILALVQHPDYRMRIAALEALRGRGDDPRAPRAILDAMRDSEPRLRNVAVGLLGSHLADWPGAEEAVWSAVHDVIAPIRGIALTTLWEGSSPLAHAALQLALQDVDPGVRALAEALARPEAAGEPSGGPQTADEGFASGADPEEIPTEVPAE